MKILITGAAGFVGAHLIEALKRKAQMQQSEMEIFAWGLNEAEAANIHLPQEQIAIVDITNQGTVEEEIKRIQPDQIYHLAAFSSVGQSWNLPALTCQVNILGTIHILEALRNFAPDSSLLLIGSAEQYGKVPQEHMPIREEEPLAGINPYSISKMTQEHLARMYMQAYGLRILMVRAFNHIGPGQGKNFVVPDWCSQIVAMERGEQEPPLKVGNVSVRRDFTDVRDIVEAYIALMEKGITGEVYNVGSGHSIGLQELLQELIALSTRTDITYEIDATKVRPADVPEFYGDTQKLRKTTGWEPVYTLSQSLSDILDSMRQA